MKKVICRIFGGVGNQLFCYAAARRLALINQAELVIDDVSGFLHDHTYQRYSQLEHFNITCRKATPTERLEPFSRARRYCRRKWNQRLPFNHRTFLTQEGMDFDPRLLSFKLQDNIYLEGYWQSEEYFKDIELTIRQDLKIKSSIDNINLKIAEKIQANTSVAIHIRFFDEPNTQSINAHNASYNYYNQAIKYMEDKIYPPPHYFIFSDRPDAIHSHISLPSHRNTIIYHNKGDNNAYKDLWLLQQCQHFIIANSTFSWWGAWLAENMDKCIIAPSFEIKHNNSLAAWGFKGLLPQKWIRL